MDPSCKLVVLLTLLYVIWAKLDRDALKAAAEPPKPALFRQRPRQTQEQQLGPSDAEQPEGGRAPYELRRKIKPADGNQFAPANLPPQQQPHTSFWDELEAQVFFVQLLNATQSRINQLIADLKHQPSERSELNKCAKFNQSIQVSRDEIGFLLNLTASQLNLVMSQPFATLADLRHQFSIDLSQQANRALQSMGNSARLYFECTAMANIEDSLPRDVVDFIDQMSKFRAPDGDAPFALLLPKNANDLLESMQLEPPKGSGLFKQLGSKLSEVGDKAKSLFGLSSN